MTDHFLAVLIQKVSYINDRTRRQAFLRSSLALETFSHLAEKFRLSKRNSRKQFAPNFYIERIYARNTRYIVYILHSFFSLEARNTERVA